MREFTFRCIGGYPRRGRLITTEKRAALWKKYFSVASNINQIVSARSADIEFTINSLESLLESIPGIDRVPVTRVIGAIGLSLGGAVATEYSRGTDNDVKCVVNMDGGIYGALLEKPINKPYLMLYSQHNSGINDRSLLSTDETKVTNETISGTKHLNYHDIAIVYPILKWLRIIGSANPMVVAERRNQLISSFISDVQELGA